MIFSTSKIEPYIPRKLSIHDKSSYSTFMKQKPKLLPKLTFSNSKKDPSQRQADSLKLLKVIKQLKHVHNVDLSQSYHYNMITDLPFIKSCAKRMSRTQYLSTLNSQNIEGMLPKRFQVWPKYLYRLKELNDSSNLSQSIFPKNLIKPRPQKELLRYQNHLESLQIKFDPISCDIGLLCFDKYPRSIKRLSLSDGIFLRPAPSTSLDSFQSLRVLEFNFHKDSSAEFINSLLCLLPRVPHLESLSLFSPLMASPELKKNFWCLKALTQLKCLKIHACNLSIPHSKVLLKVLMSLPLKSLYLKVRIEHSREVNLIINVLERLTKLEVLKLHVYHRNILYPSPLQKILGKVDNLRYLKHLSLTVNSRKRFSGAMRPRAKRETIQLPFFNLFTKTIPLESFRIESNYVQISNEAFLGLLQSLQKQALHLKKIKLAVGEVLLDSREFKKLLEFVQNVPRDIRVLKLSMIGFYGQGHFMEIVQSIGRLKYLRSFGLGKFYMQVTRLAFWKGLTKILLKHGLVKFTCDASKALKKKILALGTTKPARCLAMLKGKNPSLEKIPYFLSNERMESFYELSQHFL